MGIEPKSTSRLLGRYLGSMAVVRLAFALRLGLSGVLGSGLAYITYYPAVMLAAMLGGLGPGLLETGLAALLACYWIHLCRQSRLKPYWLSLSLSPPRLRP